MDDLSGDHSWVFDLVAADDRRRDQALARHRELLAAALQGLHRSNRISAKAGSPVPEQPHLAAEMDQAQAHIRWHQDQTIFGPIDRFLDWGLNPVTHLLYAPYAVLFLRWETSYPQQWRHANTDHGSPWGTKELLLPRLARLGVPDQVQADMTELTLAAAARPYRCKDWRYAAVVPHLRHPDLVPGLHRLAHTDQPPLTRLRAQFLLHIHHQPQTHITRTSWRRWLATAD